MAVKFFNFEKSKNGGLFTGTAIFRKIMISMAKSLSAVGNFSYLFNCDASPNLLFFNIKS